MAEAQKPLRHHSLQLEDRAVLRATGVSRDVLFCCLCGGFVFLCALAVDSGRLRLYQAALQGLGAWCVVAAFGPLARWGIGRLRKIFGKLCSLLGRWAGIPLGHLRQGAATLAHPGKKTGKKLKKPRKKT